MLDFLKSDETYGRNIRIYKEFLRKDWTTETPTENGWYWAKQIDEQEIEVVQVKDGSVLMVFYNAWVDINSYSNWLGPLPIPELPKQ